MKTMTDLPTHVDIHEEGPREGFQIEPGPISTADKIKLIEALAETGLHHIQSASFVSPRIVPGWADAEDVVAGFTPKEGVHYTALWFNASGLATLNPRLPYLALKGYFAGPYEHRPALDEVVQFQTGPAFMTGPPGQPLRAGASVIDITEDLIYDANGQLLTGSLADYLIPTGTDFPKIRAISLQHRPSPTNPLGVKGDGEGGIIPVGRLMANAVAGALSSIGAEPNELPLSPPHVARLANPSQEGE
jgi:hypothetical protein